ncbi:uncharacterized protein LOC129906060 [Episyrphus balteatus]|uniref:uncharacterized protein LOC129906060 n=1 Tax=Episyrphus balteatus TaxID=286459 RepID=UPI002485D9F6|nr:uncharacterized protein LOC129906060 [Episyrphus balteatus]
MHLINHYILLSTLLAFYTSNAYKFVRPQDYLCADKFILTLQKPFKGDPLVALGDDRESAAIITQVWNSTSHRKLKYDCRFRIVTKERQRRGLYTVITKLKFRRDPKTDACTDYIQFTNGYRWPSEKICNDISPDGPAGRLIFDERESDVSVHVYINQSQPIYEPLELSMVITSHSECKYTGDFLCDPKNPHSCISRHFVRDNITNCMYPCKDENSCFHDAITAEVIDTANVAISAITSLIFTMTGVGFCIWVCWKYWNCITLQQQQAHEDSQSNHPRDVPTIELPQTPFEGFITPVEDPDHPLPPTPKDLPPSYESLFPDR